MNTKLHRARSVLWLPELRGLLCGVALVHSASAQTPVAPREPRLGPNEVLPVTREAIPVTEVPIRIPERSLPPVEIRRSETPLTPLTPFRKPGGSREVPATPAARPTPSATPFPKTTLAPDAGRRPAEKRYLPATVQEPAMSMTIQVVNEKPGTPSIYRSRHFEFQTPVKLGQNAMREICRTFESTHELVQQLPWGIQPLPEAGMPFFKAQLFQTRAEYIASGAPTWSAGIYLRKEHAFRIPFDQVGLIGHGNEWFLRGSINNEVISHEVTHQIMHEYLDYLPVWFAEGTADYVASIPYNSGRFNLAAAFDGLRHQRAKEGGVTKERRGSFTYTKTSRRPNWVGVPELLKFTTSIEKANPIESVEIVPPKPEPPTTVPTTGIRFVSETLVTRTNPYQPEIDTNAISDRYYSAHVLVFYFMHLDGDGTGLRVKKFFDAIHEERKLWPAFWQSVNDFNAQIDVAKAKYEAEWEAFKKLPGVQDLGGGQIRYPTNLTPPAAPKLQPPVPPGNCDPKKVCVKNLRVLLDGRRPQQLEAEVQAAFAKVKFPL